MAPKTTAAESTAADSETQKTAAADESASGPVTPATGIEGVAKAAEGGAVAPAAGARGAVMAAPKTITVRGPARGRWRAGLYFGAEPVTVEMADLTDEQLLQIHGDSELTVVGVD